MKSSIKKLLTAGLIAAICVFAAGCGSNSDKAAADKEIKVGVTAGPHAEIMDQKPSFR